MAWLERNLLWARELDGRGYLPVASRPSWMIIMSRGSLKAWIKARLPLWILDRLRFTRRLARHVRWRVGVVTGAKTSVGRHVLAHQLAELGLQRGMDCMVHSSLSAIGSVEGGPDAVIDALLDVLGSDGTLLMPAYSMKGTMLETMQDREPFELTRSRSVMGAITEAFRKRPGVVRSAHPTHSVCALGPRSAEYTRRHHLSRSPCGPDSPFELLSMHRGRILCIGSGVGKVTSHHVIEDKVPAFPLRVYLPDLYRKTVVFPDGHGEEIAVLVHDPAFGRRRVDAVKEKEQQILTAMRRKGIVSEGPVGMASSYHFGAHELDDLLLELLAKGITIYQD